MARKKIDRNQVREARLHGLPNSLIAKRLGCSQRHVRRINSDLSDISTTQIAGTDMEHILWLQYQRGRGYSIRRIAWCFCLSHEHVRQVLLNKQSTNKEAA